MVKILIADDSRFMRKLLKDILVKAGYSNIIEAKDGNETIEKCKSEDPDLLFLDILMEGMNGIDVLKKIKVKTIVVSAVGREKIVKEALSLGAKVFIVKPFEDKQILKALKKVLQKD